jgi:hypothetical protein
VDQEVPYTYGTCATPMHRCPYSFSYFLQPTYRLAALNASLISLQSLTSIIRLALYLSYLTSSFERRKTGREIARIFPSSILSHQIDVKLKPCYASFGVSASSTRMSKIYFQCGRNGKKSFPSSKGSACSSYENSKLTKRSSWVGNGMVVMQSIIYLRY